MPVASVSMEPIRKELKTLPNGFVYIRRMSYGEKLDRLEQSSSSEMTQADVKRGDMKMQIKTLARKVQELDFARCITAHNLTWMNGDFEVPFDFKNDRTAFDRLDPRIAEEISGYIDEMNNFDENDEALLAVGKEVLISDSSTTSSETSL